VRAAAITQVATVVPVADEADLLPYCLRALHAANKHLERTHGLRSRIVVVLDDCTDGSSAVLAAFPEVQTVAVSARRVGTARRIGSEHALRDVVHPERSLLTATDADSTVPQHWFSELVGFAGRGADLVLGTVVPDGDDLPPGAAARYAAGYVPGDGHPHVHGANLAVRASTYCRIGGWSDRETGEDHALVAAAIRAGGVRIRRTGAVPVATSTRLIARAPYGYSSYLRGLIANSDSDGGTQPGNEPLFAG
jgi:hypothetical protein